MTASRRALALLLLLFSVSGCAGRSAHPVEKAPVSFVARGRSAVVATAHPAATAAALEMLQFGGNLVDALAASSLAVGVVRPQSTGLGGGGFAVLVLRGADGELDARAFDFRERAPRKATRELYRRAPRDASLFGALAVATPGLVAGILEIHQRFGRLPRQRVFEPAIRLAEEGFAVYPGLARASARMRSLLERHPESRRLFLPGGEPLREGQRLRQPELAATLRRIAAEGADGFYRGPVARAIAEEVRRLGGVLDEKDLRAYRVVERPVLRRAWRGFEIFAMPPPSAGGVLWFEMLAMLDAAGLDVSRLSVARRAHLLAEVMRRAYEDRARYLGDPDFVDIPLERLLSADYAASRMSSFRPDRATPAPVGAASLGGVNTTHISILDAEGNAVAATETINYAFGSGITVPGTGVVLNNEMDDFVTRPGEPNVYGLLGSEANAVAPGKTPLSSMSPTVVCRDGSPFLVLGSPGGSRIVTATLETFLNVVLLRMGLPEAVAAPRIHHQAFPNRIFYEAGALPADARAELERMGHELEETEPMGDVQAAMREADGSLVAVSDPRGDGRPGGF